MTEKSSVGSAPPVGAHAAPADQPRCPLGFTGTPPPGHPSYAGSTTSGSPSASSRLGLLLTNVPTSLDPRKWTTGQTLLVEVFFLLLCVAVAIWMPNIKRSLLAGGDSSSSSSSGKVGASTATLKTKLK